MIEQSARSPQHLPLALWHAARRIPVFGWALLACVLLASLSLLLPSAPTYDPWAWIIWGREIAHLNLDTQLGPSWKPLPVLFTTVFSAFGGAAPYLWLIVARAGGLACLCIAFRLTKRLTQSNTAAALAVFGIVSSLDLTSPVPYAWLHNVALGNSEQLFCALALLAVDRHLDRYGTQAFGLGLLACLLRPEAWPFFGIYAVYLWFREPRKRRLIVAGVALIPLLWFGPEIWGSGDPLRASTRAMQPRPDSLTFTRHPALGVLSHAQQFLEIPLELGALYGALYALVTALRRRGSELALLGLATAAAVWLATVAILTHDGYSGNTRYLVPAATLLSVIGAVGLYHAIVHAAGLVSRLAVSSRAHRYSQAVSWVLVFCALFPGAIHRARQVPIQVRALAYEAKLNTDLHNVIYKRNLNLTATPCGPVATDGFLVPNVAWQLGLPIAGVGVTPKNSGLILSVHRTLPINSANPRDPIAQPPLPPPKSSFTHVATAGQWTAFASCPQPSTPAHVPAHGSLSLH